MSQPNEQPNEIRRDAANMSEVARSESVRVTDDGITEVGFDDPELRPLPPDKLHYHVPHPDPHPEAHEHSDVPIRPLVITLVALVVIGLATHVLLYFVFWRYEAQQKAQEIPRTAVPAAKPNVPEPRLQGVPGFSDNHPTQDLLQMRARYQAELDGYGANGDAPTARIPINRAMELALERRIFPVAQSAGSAEPAGTAQGAANVQGATSQQRGPQRTTQPSNPQQNEQNDQQQNTQPTPRGGQGNPAQRPGGQGGEQ